MGEIEYRVHTGQTIDDRLGVPLISTALEAAVESFMNLNVKYKTYNEQVLKAFFERYTPKKIKVTDESQKTDQSETKEVLQLPFDSSLVAVVAYEGKELVGTGFLAKGKFIQRSKRTPSRFTESEHDAFLYGFHVEPKYEARGVGREFLRKITRVAKNNGIGRIQTIIPNFPETVKYYQTLGFGNIQDIEFREKNSQLILKELQLVLSQSN
ncbi:GNAT family N-acetyltransferase [Candidatus Woesearchaeota archaeon]|nr:GNAT family N-acetyltransferase [Candidatus Woesearchaeota archaeon]